MLDREMQLQISEEIKKLSFDAHLGNPHAQYELGKRYHLGDGVDQDLDEANYWFKRAASHKESSGDAEIYLGSFNELGIAGYEKNPEIAFAYYQKSMQKVNPLGFYNIGRCYLYEKGVPKDVEQAVLYFRAAIKLGCAKAEYYLGLLHLKGNGVERCDYEAIKLFESAAIKGDSKAQYEFALCYANGKVVTQNDQKAFSWCLKAAEQDLAQAQFQLGKFYAEGKGTPKDESLAATWLQLAVDQACPGAEEALAILKCRPIIELPALSESNWILLQKAREGDVQAQFDIGLYFYTKSKELQLNAFEDAAEAVKWWQKAAIKNHAEAQYKLAYCYKHGMGVEEDRVEAAKWFEVAAKQGHRFAQASLGECYLEGDGIAEDFNKAIYYFELSVKNGRTLSALSTLAEITGETFGCNILKRLGVPFDVEPTPIVEESNKKKKGKKSKKNIKSFEHSYLVYSDPVFFSNNPNPEIAFQKDLEIERYLLPKANNGNYYAQLNLGKFYYFHAERNSEYPAKAVEWFKKAVSNYWYCQEAQYYLGQCYLQGVGVAKDQVEGFKLIQKSANSYYRAQYDLALANLDGTFFNKKYAAHLLGLSTINGNMDAHKMLIQLQKDFIAEHSYAHIVHEPVTWVQRRMFLTSRDRKPNFTADLSHLTQQEKEARQNNIDKASLIYKTGWISNFFDIGFLFYISGKKVKEDAETAVFYFDWAAQLGCILSLFSAGFCYERGEGVRENPREAMRLYELAEKYDLKIPSPPDFAPLGTYSHEEAEALEYYLDALKDPITSAKEGIRRIKMDRAFSFKQIEYPKISIAPAVEKINKPSQKNSSLVIIDESQQRKRKRKELSSIKPQASTSSKQTTEKAKPKRLRKDTFHIPIEIADKRKKNMKQVSELWDAATKQNDASAQFRIGSLFYEFRKEIKQDGITAVEWFKKSADQGYAQAQFSLGFCYANGECEVTQNDEEAFKLYEKSAQQNHKDAQYCLGVCYEKGNGTRADEAKAIENYRSAAMSGNTAAISALQRIKGKGPEIPQQDSQIKHANTQSFWQTASNLASNVSQRVVLKLKH